MEVVQRPAHDQRVDYARSTPTKTRCSATRKVVTANNVLLALSVALAVATAFVASRRAPRRGPACAFFALAVLGFLFATYAAEPLHFGRTRQLGRVPRLPRAGGRCPVRGRVPAARRAAPRTARSPRAGGHRRRARRSTCWPARGSSSTPCSATRRRSASGSSGQGNITFSQLTAAVLLLGGLAVWRRPGRRTVYAVIAMLAVTLLVMAAPPFGGDFGAAIAGAPGFGLFAWLLLGRRIRVRTVAILGAVLVVSGLLVGFADLLRPTDQQTHVGRFFDEVANGGARATSSSPSGASSTENLASFGGTKLLWVLPIVALLAWYLWRHRGGRDRGRCSADVPVDPPDPARARGGRGARLRAQRLRDRHPRGHGAGVRVRPRVRRRSSPANRPCRPSELAPDSRRLR